MIGFICLSLLITPPVPPAEQIFQVTLIELPPVTKPDLATLKPDQIPPLPQPNATASATQKSAPSAPAPRTDARANGLPLTRNNSEDGIPASNNPVTDETGIGAGSGTEGGGSDGIGNSASTETKSAPAPGSMGYEAATAIYTMPPVYPRQQSQTGIGGTAYILIQIAADGSILSCDIATSSGNEALDQAALAAAWQSSFRPAKDIATGKNVSSTILVPFLFESTTVTKEEDSLW